MDDKPAAVSYYWKNRKRRLQYQKEWRNKNPGYATKKSKEWRERNRERYNELQRLGRKRKKYGFDPRLYLNDGFVVFVKRCMDAEMEVEDIASLSGKPKEEVENITNHILANNAHTEPTQHTNNTTET